jgi:hypothetical protein
MESWPENCLIDGGVRVDGLASDIECALVQLNKKLQFAKAAEGTSKCCEVK